MKMKPAIQNCTRQHAATWSCTRASEALFIHRSTLLYRLDKIRHILKTDFSDPQELLYLLLSFYLIDMEERH